MAVAGDLVSDLARRVRDPQNTAHTRATVRDILDRAQVLLVRYYGVLIRERVFTHTVSRCLYELDPADTLRILDIFLDTTEKRLFPVQWPQLFHQAGPLWWRTTVDGDPTTWAYVGTKHFVIWPAPFDTAVDVIIREQHRPAALTADTVTIELPDEHVPALMDLAEALILLRGRDAALAEALPQVQALVAEEGA